MQPPLDPADRLWMASGWTMLHFLGAGSLIGLVALVGRIALRRSGPDLRYGFALACLAALAVAPIPLAARAWGDLAGPIEAPPSLDRPIPNREESPTPLAEARGR